MRIPRCPPEGRLDALTKTEDELRAEGFEIAERRDDFCPDGFQGGKHRLWLIVAQR